LGIQTNLINLYSNNLSAVATQAALIAGFSFSAVIATNSADNTDDVEVIALSYFYYVFFTICLVTALFILSQATIVVMFGPTLALKGATDDAVKFAAAHMMNQQLIILRAAFVSITSLFVGSCILCWANYPYGIATLCTVVYLVSYHYLVKEGYAAYRIFVPEDSSAFVEPLLDANGAVIAGGTNNTAASSSSPSFRLMTSSNTEAKDDAQAEKAAAANANLQQAQEVRTRNVCHSIKCHHSFLQATKLKIKATIWKRQSVEDGGLFVKYYGVLEKGRLDLYYKEKVVFKLIKYHNFT
jgi:hypothetical protein